MRGDLEELAAGHLEETEWLNDVNDLLRRATELLPRAPSDKRQELIQALERFNQQVGRANEKRGQWIKKFRERAESEKRRI